MRALNIRSLRTCGGVSPQGVIIDQLRQWKFLARKIGSLCSEENYIRTDLFTLLVFAASALGKRSIGQVVCCARLLGGGRPDQSPVRYSRRFTQGAILRYVMVITAAFREGDKFTLYQAREQRKFRLPRKELARDSRKATDGGDRLRLRKKKSASVFASILSRSSRRALRNRKPPTWLARKSS